MKTTININGKPVEIELTKEQVEAIKKASEKITDGVKTFEDACKVLNINGADVEISFATKGLDKDLRSMEAYVKLTIIVRALNEGWEPDFDNHSQYKYHPLFKKVSPGAGFSFIGCNFAKSYSFVGPSIVFKSSELAEYAGKQFESIYNDFLNL